MGISETQGAISIVEYVMVDREKMAVTRFRKEAGWKPGHLSEGDCLSLPSIGFELSLEHIYEDVET